MGSWKQFVTFSIKESFNLGTKNSMIQGPYTWRFLLERLVSL